jgi:hypothetical protein
MANNGPDIGRANCIPRVAPRQERRVTNYARSEIAFLSICRQHDGDAVNIVARVEQLTKPLLMQSFSPTTLSRPWHPDWPDSPTREPTP